MPAFGLNLPLWSYAADPDWLDRVAGEVGLDHVTVPAVTGPRSEFALSRLGPLAREPREPYFSTEGGWHFPPNGRLYAAAGARPPKAKWFAAADWLARLREHVERLGLRLTVEIDVRGIPALLEAEPHLAQQNAWDQPVLAAGACVSNPNLRELLRCALDDLAQYAPAAWQIDDWTPDEPVDRAVVRPVGWAAPLRRLLDICFCPACRQIGERTAGDPDVAARAVRATVERYCAARPPVDEQAISPDATIADYVRARAADCAAWLERLVRGTPNALWLCYDQGAVPALPVAGGSRLARLPRRAEGEPANAALEALRADSQPAPVAGWALEAWRPMFGDAAALVRLVNEGAQRGLQRLDFERLTDAAPEAVTWLKQAVRFARRV